MPGNLSAFTSLGVFGYPIPERSEATPGLFNQIFSGLSANLDRLNSDVSNIVGSSVGTTESVLGFSSNTLRTESGNTILLPVGAQSFVVRQLPSYTSTYNALWFGSATSSKESRIQNACNQAAADNIAIVRIPQVLLPFSASSVTFNANVKLVREGGNPAYWDVQAYGAAGDGTTNDYSSFSAAHAALPTTGGTLYIPGVSTSYKIGTEWLITKPCTILGDGLASKVIQTAATNTIHVQGVNGVAIRNLWLVGSGATAAATSANVVYFDSTNQSSIYDCTLDNGRIHNFFADSCSRCILGYNTFQSVNAALGETDSSDLRFRSGAASNNDDNLIIGNRCLSANKQSGIMFQQIALAPSFNRNRIVENFVDGSIQNGTANGHGIVLYILTNVATTLNNNVIALNTIRNTQGIGIYLAGAGTTASLAETVVIGNSLVNCNTVGSGGALADGAIGVVASLRNRIMANAINGGGSAQAAAIQLQAGSDRCVVAENIGINLGSFGNGGCYINGASTNIQVLSNYFAGTSGTMVGIFINGGSQHQASLNYCDTGLIGIWVNGAFNDCAILGNFINTMTGAAIQVNAGANRTRILNNSGFGNGSLIADSGTGTERRGNRGSTSGTLQGRAVLVAGTVTVNTGEVLAGDNIILTCGVAGGTVGALSIGNIVAGTSFVINSTSAADTSTVFWEIEH